MNYLKSFVKGNEEAAPSGAETVARLCSRVASSTLLDDRRDAVRALKSLSKKFRVEVGTQALPHLFEVLKNDSSDEDITAYALETLYNLSSSDEDDEGMDVPPEVVTTFVENFIERTDYPITAIQMIDRYEFPVRWAAIRLLTAILKEKPNEIQQIVLIMPMGVSRIMDLLADNREVVRNDTLLALIELTRENPNIQKIVAFESGFESILNIMHEEGMIDGGVVVEDCLLLLLQLLKNNTSNQQFFKEGSLIQRLTPFFDIDLDSQWSAQRCANFLLMLKVIRTLVSPFNPSNVTSSCQLAMQQCSLLQSLCQYLMSTSATPDMLTETINTVSEIIRGCSENQRFFASVMAHWDTPTPALVVILTSMVNPSQPYLLRCAVLYCFQSYLHKNPEGQSHIVGTLLPSSLENRDVLPGQLLCSGIFSATDSLSNWLSATAMAYSIRLNEDAKQQLLRVQLTTTSGNPPIPFLRQLAVVMQQTPNLQTRVGVLSLLCSWLTDFPPAVAQFLQNKAAISFLLSQVAENGTGLEFVAHGICALLLGICVIENDGSVTQYDKESLIKLIGARVGIDRFCDALTCVNQCDLYTKALQRPQPSADKQEHLLFSHAFAKLFKSQEDLIVKKVSNLEEVKKEEEVKAAMRAHDSIVSDYKALIREQDSKLEELKTKCSKLESDFLKSSSSLAERDMQLQQLQQHYAILSASGTANAGETIASLNEQIEKLKEDLAQKESELTTSELIVDQLKSLLDGNSSGDADNNPDVKSLQDQIEDLSLSLKEKDEKISELIEAAATGPQVESITDAMSQELLAANQNTEELRNEVQQLREENEKCSGKVVTLKIKVQEEVEESNSLKERLRESEESCEQVKKEQEDLLLLLSDQEEKLEQYKKKLIDLGVEVSSDDEGDAELSGLDSP